MAFDREVLVDIEGFHVSLGPGTPTMAGEDTFAFTRMLLARHTLVYQPTALVFHHHRETLADLKKQLYGYGTGEIAFYAALIAYQPKLLFSLLRLHLDKSSSFEYESARIAAIPDIPASALLRELQLGKRRGVPAFVKSVIKQRGVRRTRPTPALNH